MTTVTIAKKTMTSPKTMEPPNEQPPSLPAAGNDDEIVEQDQGDETVLGATAGGNFSTPPRTSHPLKPIAEDTEVYTTESMRSMTNSDLQKVVLEMEQKQKDLQLQHRAEVEYKDLLLAQSNQQIATMRGSQEIAPSGQDFVEETPARQTAIRKGNKPKTTQGTGQATASWTS